MSHRTITRLLLALAVAASGWLVTGVGVAHALRPPEPEDGTITSTPVIDPTGTPILQFVLVAALACLLSVAATLAIEPWSVTATGLTGWSTSERGVRSGLPATGPRFWVEVYPRRLALGYTSTGIT